MQNVLLGFVSLIVIGVAGWLLYRHFYKGQGYTRAEEAQNVTLLAAPRQCEPPLLFDGEKCVHPSGEIANPCNHACYINK